VLISPSINSKSIPCFAGLVMVTADWNMVVIDDAVTYDLQRNPLQIRTFVEGSSNDIIKISLFSDIDALTGMGDLYIYFYDKMQWHLEVTISSLSSFISV